MTKHFKSNINFFPQWGIVVVETRNWCLRKEMKNNFNIYVECISACNSVFQAEILNRAITFKVPLKSIYWRTLEGEAVGWFGAKLPLVSHQCSVMSVWDFFLVFLAISQMHGISSADIAGGLNHLSPLNRDWETNLLKCPSSKRGWKSALMHRIIWSLLWVFGLICYNSHFINCNSFSFAKRALYLI